jgi:hypothetical protein
MPMALRSALCALVLLNFTAVSAQQAVNGVRRTAVAVPIERMLTLDGNLDETEWLTAAPATDFRMKEPYDDRPATERTEVRILYNKTHLYIGVVCFESEMDRIRISDLVEDHSNNPEDSFGVVFDTFGDAQNSVQIETNPAGTRTDYQQSSNGSIANRDWDGIWNVRTTRRSDAWIAEMVVPFTTLRFSDAAEQVWSINFRRRVRRKNEESVWNPLNRSQNFWTPSLAGRLVGLKDLRPGRNLALKPYALAGVSNPRNADSASATKDAGLDVKYGVTSGLTLDATYRTDFAQADVDQQQINLTRFSLLYPEKREFFLENAGLFSFGGQSPTSGGGGGFGAGGGGGAPRQAPFGSNDFILFFSRRIGLSAAGTPVPVDGGVRLTGRVGQGIEIGALNITTSETSSQPRTNYSVAKVRKNMFGGSDVGAMVIDREAGSGDFTRVVGFEQNLRAYANQLSVNSYWAQAFLPSVSIDNQSWGLSTSWRDRRRTAGVSYRTIGSNFDNDVGFVRRKDVRQFQPYAGMFIRPGIATGILKSVLEVSPLASVDYVTTTTGRLATKTWTFSTDVTFRDGSKLSLARIDSFDRVERDFITGPNVQMPAGDYDVTETKAEYFGDESRRIALHGLVSTGVFYGGTKQTYGVGVQFRPTYRFMIRPEVSRNNITLPFTSFVSDLHSLNAAVALTPAISFTSNVQYNSNVRQVFTNLRFRYNYRPWNDLYIVYNEIRDTFRVLPQRDRTLIVKLTYALVM